MEVLLFAFILFFIPYGIGIALFLYLPRKEEILPWQIYTILRGLVFSLFLMPTFIVAGHGGMLTNTIAGFIATIVFGGFNVRVKGLVFGAPGGAAIYLEPFLIGFVIYIVIFILDIIIHRKRIN